MFYLAAIHPASPDAFCVRLPDFPDVERRCRSIREAERQANRAVRAALDRLARGGLKAPRPTRKEELQDEPAYRCAFLIRVEVDDASVD